ncbi:MAG TPA: ABC transporter permease [Gemmatimonadaceae bacterium]|jgi:predicted permease
MSFLDGVRYRLGVWLHPTRHARQIEREMRLHLEMDAAQREHDAPDEVTHADAWFAAKRQFGNVTYLQEEARRMTANVWLDTIERDLRFAARSMRRAPGFTIAVVVTLALGIGANAAMFSLVDRLLFRPPALLTSPNRVHHIYTAQTVRGNEAIGSYGPYARYADFAKSTTSFDLTTGVAQEDLAVGIGDASREMHIGIVSASFFKFFDAPPALGRYFGADEDTPPNGSAVAVASYARWQTEYGGSRAVLGTKVQIGSVLYTIIGVTPPDFAGIWSSQPPAYYVPITTYGAAEAAANSSPSEHWWTTYHWYWMETMARTRPGVSDARTNADLTQAFIRSIQAERGGTKEISQERPRAFVGSILSERGPNASGFAKVATWVGGVALVVLLIACANVANLLFARALRRRREIAVRLALGVSRARLLSQLLTESVLLAIFGGIVGILVAQWSSIGLRAAFLPKDAEISVWRDERTILFAGIAALVTGLLIGVAPVVQARRADLTGDLKAGAREGTHQRSRLRIGLLVMQGALSVILLVGAGLFVRSLNQVRNIRLGYDVGPVLIVHLNMRGVQLDSVYQVALRQRLLQAALTTRSVVNASFQTGIPFWSTWSVGLSVPGIGAVGRLGRFDVNAVSPGYFGTLGTRILRGRGILGTDLEHSPLVMVVSEKMGSTLWPGEDPIGKCVRLGVLDTIPCRTVVGIAEDIKSHQLSNEPDMYYYLPATQFNPNQTGLFVRVRGDAATDADAVRRSLQREMPAPSYVTTTPLSQVIGGETRSWKLGASMFSAFGLLALVLAAIGLYSVIAYNVAQRTHEIGVRVALGARAGDVLRLVILDGVRLSIVGVGAGGVIAFLAAPRLAPLLFQESARDPAVYAIVAITLVAVSVAASWLPAYRASRIEPTRALRHE